MTDQEINIAIAKSLGWVKRIYGGWGEPNDPPDEYGPEDKVWDRITDFPDYVNDLNAMHEVEKTLTLEEENKYVTTLCLEVQSIPRLHHATSRERAKAYLIVKNI
jgi:hypothetical protein